MIEKTGGGLLVEPDNAESLAEGLYALWHDRALRETLGQRAAQGVRAHYAIAKSADRLLAVYEEMVAAQVARSPGKPENSKIFVGRGFSRDIKSA
jgi:glycosyltransferase involved in cell wall biosynthesis